jgi:hypothetical protein
MYAKLFTCADQAGVVTGIRVGLICESKVNLVDETEKRMRDRKKIRVIGSVCVFALASMTAATVSSAQTMVPPVDNSTTNSIVAAPAAPTAPALPESIVPEPSLAIAPGVLPFDQMPIGQLRSYPKKVFAHYFPTFIASIDNKPPDQDYYATEFLTPEGEGGRHASSGGYINQRPLPVSVKPYSNWDELDMEDEVQRASAIGLDGFTLDILTTSGPVWDHINDLFKAATIVDPSFKIVLMPDMAAELKTQPENIVPMIETLAKYPSTFRLPDGRVVVAPFDAQNQTPQWWHATLARLKRDGVNVAFIPLFQGWTKYADEYASISYGFSDWGSRNPAGVSDRNQSDTGPAARQYVKLWMAPVSPQDTRPKALTYQEADNTLSYRLMWKGALDGDADWVQMVTWNDYSESTEIAPSNGTNYVYYDLTAYYVQWFKTGQRPNITHDVLYCVHRNESTTALPDLSKQQKPYDLLGNTPASNKVEVLAFTTSPGTVRIDDGGQISEHPVKAGMTSVLVPLNEGKVTYSLIRDGQTVVSGTSPTTVSNQIVYQNLLYFGSSSSRQ